MASSVLSLSLKTARAYPSLIWFTQAQSSGLASGQRLAFFLLLFQEESLILSQSEAGLAGTAGGRWGATGTKCDRSKFLHTPAFSGITMLNAWLPRHVLWDHDHFEDCFLCNARALALVLRHPTFLNLLLLQDTYLNQLLSEEEPVWVIYTNKKSLLGSEA